MRVILAPEPRNFHRLRKVDAIVVKKLQERVAPFVLLCRIEKKKSCQIFPPIYLHSRIMRIILAQGPCQVLQILEVSPKKTGGMLLFFKKTVCTCHPCTKGHVKFSAQKKNNVQLTPCRREDRHSCARSPRLCGRVFRDIRTIGRAVKGSNVSPLTNTMGGLSGCRRHIRSLFRSFTHHFSTSCPSFGLGVGLWHLLSSLRHEESMHHRRLQNSTTQELSHA